MFNIYLVKMKGNDIKKNASRKVCIFCFDCPFLAIAQVPDIFKQLILLT